MGFDDEYFGKYAWISLGHANNKHVFKIVGGLRTNYYCDVPLTLETMKLPYNHGEMTDVLNVIHCGIDESEVLRVPLKDCEIVRGKTPTWEWLVNHVGDEALGALVKAKEAWEAEYGYVG